VLALLVVGSFLLLTLTYGQASGGLQRGVSSIFSPFQDVADRALKPARDLVNWFDETLDARGENNRLKEELAEEREAAIAGEAALDENRQLRKLLEFNRGPALATSALEPETARVIGRAPTYWNSTITIDLGGDDGVEVDDPVVSEGSLIGRVASVEGSASQVKLIIDPSSVVSAKVVPGGVKGVIRPEIGDPEDLILDYIDKTKSIRKGQSVVTSGWRTEEFGSLFPPNIPVGEVTRASIEIQEASQQVRLRPYADLANLDIVEVLTGGSDRR
jgi:rod shape-determining protein MreC